MKSDVTAPRRRRGAPGGLDVLQQLRVVVRLAGSHSARLERSTGIPGAQLWALHEVAQADGLSVGELARRLRMHQTTVSNLLNRLDAAEQQPDRAVGGDAREVPVPKHPLAGRPGRQQHQRPGHDRAEQLRVHPFTLSRCCRAARSLPRRAISTSRMWPFFCNNLITFDAI